MKVEILNKIIAEQDQIIKTQRALINEMKAALEKTLSELTGGEK